MGNLGRRLSSSPELGASLKRIPSLEKEHMVAGLPGIEGLFRGASKTKVSVLRL